MILALVFKRHRFQGRETIMMQTSTHTHMNRYLQKKCTEDLQNTQYMWLFAHSISFNPRCSTVPSILTTEETATQRSSLTCIRDSKTAACPRAFASPLLGIIPSSPLGLSLLLSPCLCSDFRRSVRSSLSALHKRVPSFHLAFSISFTLLFYSTYHHLTYSLYLFNIFIVFLPPPLNQDISSMREGTVPALSTAVSLATKIGPGSG